MRAILVALAVLCAVPAYAGSQVGIVYDAVTGAQVMVIVPDHDWELDDPAYAPPGTKQMRVPIDQFRSLAPADVRALIPVKPSVKSAAPPAATVPQ